MANFSSRKDKKYNVDEIANQLIKQIKNNNVDSSKINIQNTVNTNTKNNNSSLWDTVKETADDLGKNMDNMWQGLKNGVLSFRQQLGRVTQDNPINSSINMQNNFLQEQLNKSSNNEKAKTLLNKNIGYQKKENETIDKYLNSLQGKINKNNQKIIDNTNSIDNPILKKLSELTPSIGQMLPGMIGGPAGAIYFTGSASGNYYNDAMQRGMTKEQATMYSGTMGVIEGTLESIGAGLTKNVGKQLLKKNIKGALLNYGLDIGENFLEESIVEPLSEISAQIYAGKDKANWENIGQRMVESGVDGALVSAITGGVSGTIGAVGSKVLKQNTTNQNNNLNLQSQSTQDQQILPTQQTAQQENKMAQNGNMKPILPVQKYVYEKSVNVKVDNLRQDASKYWDNSEKTRNYVNMLEKIIQDKNIDIRLDANLRDSKGRIANGSYSNGVMTINPNSTRAGEFIAVHELTHAIGTNQMRNIVEKYRKSNTEFNSAVEKLLKNYDTTELTEEAMADVAGQLFGNQEFINNLAQTEPSLFQKIYNEIKYLWHQFAGYKNQDQFINDLQYKWEQAYRSNAKLNETTNYSIAGRKALENIKSDKVLYNQAIKNYNLARNMAKHGRKNAEIMEKTGWFKDDTGKLKFSFSDKDMNLKNIRFQEDVIYNLEDILEHDTLFTFYPELRKYKVEFKDINKGRKKSNGYVTGAFSRKDKEIRLDIYRANSKIDTEGTLIHEIQHAIQNIEGFRRGTSRRKGKKQYQKSLGEIEARDTARRFINEKYNGLDISNILPESATFDRNILDKMKDALYNYFNKLSEGVNDEEVGRINKEDNERNKILVVDGINGQENSEKGSFSMQDNQGRTLSKEQQEYFKDSKARDENGNLLTVYHGTNNSGFTEFKRNVNYFTDNKDVAQTYTGNKGIYEGYVNIKNPTIIDANGEIWSKIDIDNILINGIDDVKDFLNSYGTSTWKEEGKVRTSTADLISAIEDAIDEGEIVSDGVIIKNIYDEGGYSDSVGGKLGTDYITFNSNQFKNVDNIKPTSNKDIRYSLPTKEWQQYLEDNYKSTGTRTNLQDIKLPTKQEKNMPINEEKRVAQILEKPIHKVKEKDRTWAIIKANLIDKGMVFEELSRKAGNRNLQGKWDYTLTSTARGQNAIGKARYELDPNTKTQKQISKSLTDIIDEVGENTADFYSYMYHQLNIDRMTLEERFGADTGINYERKKEIKNKPVFGESVTAQMSREKVQEIEKKYPKFKEYAQDVYDYLDANTKELVDNGVISKETQQLFKDMYPHYVPISRIDTKGSAINVPLDTGRTGINSPIKRATGGSRDINPLFETMADRTLQTYRASARNNFGVELKNTLSKTNELNQMTQQSDIDTIMEEMTDEKQNNQLLQEGKNGEKPTFTVFENGNKVTYEISKDMYDALKPKNELLAKFDETKLSKGLNKINNFRRGLLTEYNPVFSLTNAIKDSQDILLNSQHFAKTYFKIPEATAQILSKGYWYNEYIQNGGAQNSYFKDGEFEVAKNNVPTKIKNVITFPLRTISKVNNVVEMTPRLAEYIASREQGRSIETSMLDASRVTTNFKAGGDITKTLNRNGVTFLNASVQGMQQQIRNIQEANAKGLKGYAVLACKYAIAGAPVLLLNNLIWDDDEEYNELQDYVKDNYYIIGKLPNGKFLRIPKGRAVATIQKIVSNANEFVKNDTINSDEVGKIFWEDMKENIKFGIDNLAPNNPLENNILSPVIQAITNKTWYGEDLVPTRLQNKPKEEQYDETTDKFSKWLGEKTGMSPIKINYLLDQYSGGAGDVLLPLGTPQAENNVIEDKFTTDSTMKNKYPGEFFSKVDELEINSNSSKATDEDIVKYKYISSVSSEIGKLYKKKREIQNSNETDEKKKSQLKEVQKQINELAKNSLENVDKITKGDKYAQIDKNQYYKDVEEEWQKVSDKDKEKNKKSELSLKTYSSYKYQMSKVKQQKVNKGEMTKDQSLKNDDKIQILLNSNYSDKEKSAIYENYIKTQTKKGEYDSFDVIKASNIDIDEYLKFEQQDFASDKKDDGTLDGKTVSNSKKQKVVNYINSMKIERNQRLLLYAMQGYSTTSAQKSQLAQYVYGLKLDKDTKLELYNKFSGFKVYKDGRVQW